MDRCCVSGGSPAVRRGLRRQEVLDLLLDHSHGAEAPMSPGRFAMIIPAVLTVGMVSCSPIAGGPAVNQPEVKISRDMQYWRGQREESPGPFLCQTPAATNVTVGTGTAGTTGAVELQPATRTNARIRSRRIVPTLSPGMWGVRAPLGTVELSPASPC